MTTDTQENPLTDFSGCHVGITRNFTKLGELPALVAQPDKAEQVRQTAAELRQFFRDVVLQHHTDEEKELFAAVKAVLRQHLDQGMLASGYIGRLTEEHRHLEGLWAYIEPDIKRLEKGKPVELKLDAIQQLSADYLAHANFEEQYFLPLAEQLLSVNDMAALGMSLHMRHLDDHTNTCYI